MSSGLLPPRPLVPLPPQPDEVPFPAGEWPAGELPSHIAGPVEALVDELFGDADRYATTYAAVLVHRGRLVLERYGGELPHFDEPPTPVGPTTPLLSWSMAKSMLHAVVGMLVAEGRLGLEAPAPVPEWSAPGDPRGAVTLEHLLEMRDGLDFKEDYVDAAASDVIEMLFGAGQHDVAHFAADRSLAAPPGARFSYSSGASNIISGIVGREVGPGGPYEAFLAERVFTALGMAGARGASMRVEPGWRRRTSTPRRAITPASACSTCATASGTGAGSCRKAGSTTPACLAR